MTTQTIRDVLSLSTDFLEKKHLHASRRCAEELISSVLGLKRLDLYMLFDQPLADKELDACRSGLERLAKREPWQYVIGFVEFYDCHIAVTKDVLIPRHETEILTDKVLELLKDKSFKGNRVWDLCCGSACMAIALKKALPELEVSASDLSTNALALARKNAEINSTDLSFHEGDLFAAFEGETVDLIVCNPPYVTEAEWAELEPEVRDFEPREALVSGVEGTEFYARLAIEGKRYLNEGGILCLEIGTGQEAAVEALFRQAEWGRMECKKDWASHDRFFFAWK
jgi:release factor glutamine methyltransferase